MFVDFEFRRILEGFGLSVEHCVGFVTELFEVQLHLVHLLVSNIQVLCELFECIFYVLS